VQVVGLDAIRAAPIEAPAATLTDAAAW